jgi:hypothetical protein
MARNKGRKRRQNVSAQHTFAQIPSVQIPRSGFDRSNGLKTTFNSGDLVPVFLDEALPGDTMTMNMHSFARMATPLHPIMDTLKLDVFFFSVPVRLVWENWQKFCGEKENPADTATYIVPTVGPGVMGQGEGTLWDYFGLPLMSANTPMVCSFWHRAYNRIWNEWFRDENLQDSVPMHINDASDPPADYTILKRGKRHDYFTSCLPWPQKGPAVLLPLGTSAPVVTNEENPLWINEALTSTETEMGYANTSNLRFYPKVQTGLTELDTMQFGSETGLQADLTAATAATINQIREAFQIQKLYERDARGGTRYTEILRSHFGVVSPDQRLQRPEYLGGGSANITVNPVAQTSNTISTGTDASPQGNLSAFVTSAESYPSWTKSFTEHCVIIGMVSVRADLNYQANLPRMFSRSTRWDFYWPSLAHIGEQAVLNQELYWSGDAHADNEKVFGYQERWAEYRYKPSQITGLMRSQDVSASLDTWHLAQDFSALPLLNSSFIEENPPVERVVAVTSEPEFLFDAFFQYKCVRPMPTYSVPGFVDHF